MGKFLKFNVSTQKTEETAAVPPLPPKTAICRQISGIGQWEARWVKVVYYIFSCLLILLGNFRHRLNINSLAILGIKTIIILLKGNLSGSGQWVARWVKVVYYIFSCMLILWMNFKHRQNINSLEIFILKTKIILLKDNFSGLGKLSV